MDGVLVSFLVFLILLSTPVPHRISAPEEPPVHRARPTILRLAHRSLILDGPTNGREVSWTTAGWGAGSESEIPGYHI